MSEQKPEYVVILDSNTISAGRRINALAAEGYEVVAQSSSSLPGQESGWFTTWTLRLRPGWRQEPVPPAVQDDRMEALEKRLAELETLTSQQKLQAVDESAYVSGLMVDLRALQTAEKDDRKAICDHDYKLAVLEREVKHLRANLEANIERTDRLLAIQKATDEMANESLPPALTLADRVTAVEGCFETWGAWRNETNEFGSACERRLDGLESRLRRLVSQLGHSFWTKAEINGMACRVLVSGRTEETGRE